MNKYDFKFSKSYITPEDTEVISAFTVRVPNDAIIVGTGLSPSTGDFIPGEERRYTNWNIKNVILPTGVEMINDNAFWCCYDLDNLSIAKDTNSFDCIASGGVEILSKLPLLAVGDNAFAGCRSLNGTTLKLKCVIGDSAFEDIKIQKVDVSMSPKVGKAAFKNCGIENVTLPEIETLSDEMFASNEFTTLTIRRYVTHIGKRTFQDCKNLKQLTIYDLQSIDEEAFCRCTSLSEIEYMDEPGQPDKIGKRAFAGCASLKEFCFSDNLKEISEGCFEGSGLTKVVLPQGLKKIGVKAFANCTGLQEIHIPEGVEEIGDEAFAGCTALRVITFPKSLKHMGKHVLKNAKLIEEIDIPACCEAIEEDEFKDFKNLKKLTLHEGLKRIGKYAFFNDEKLTSLVLPTTLEEIGISAFIGCPLELLDFNGLANAKLMENSFSAAKRLVVKGLGKKTVDHLFSRCEDTEEIVLPETIETLAEFTFDGCKKLNKVNHLPHLKRICSFAFDGCTDIKTLNITADVSFENSAFEGTGLALRKWINSHPAFAKLSAEQQKAVLGESNARSNLRSLLILAIAANIFLSFFFFPPLALAFLLLTFAYFTFRRLKAKFFVFALCLAVTLLSACGEKKITVKGADGTEYESYQECCAAQDFQAAHQYLAKMQNDEDFEGDYYSAKEFVFKQEALYLMSQGDEASKKRIIYLLKEEGGNDNHANMLIDLAIDAEDEDFVKALTKQYNGHISSEVLRKIVEFLYIEKGEGNLDFVQTMLNRYNESGLLLDAAVEKGNEDLVVSLTQQVSGPISFLTFKNVMDFLELRNNNNYQKLFSTLALKVEDNELIEYATEKKQMVVVNKIRISELEEELKSLLEKSDFKVITKGIHEDDISVDGPECNEKISRFNQECIKVLRKAINYKQMKMANRAISLMKPNIVTHTGKRGDSKVEGVTVGYGKYYAQYVNSEINEAKNILNQAVHSGAFK